MEIVYHILLPAPMSTGGCALPILIGLGCLQSPVMTPPEYHPLSLQTSAIVFLLLSIPEPGSSPQISSCFLPQSAFFFFISYHTSFFLLKKKILILVSGYFAYVCMHACNRHLSSAHGGQALGPLELELYTVASKLPLVLGIELNSGRAGSALNAKPSLCPLYGFCLF